MSSRPARVCVVGDELVAGLGDPRALGWVGRVAVRTRDEDGDPAVAMLPLGVPEEDTAALRERWAEEAQPRWDRQAAPLGNRLVVGLGHADARAGVSLARSRLNLADVVDTATQGSVPCFVVGPPPPRDPALHSAVAELSHGWQDVAQRRGVPYVDCFSALAEHDRWFADLDGELPGQVGYGLLAWLVLHGGWHRWMGLTPPE